MGWGLLKNILITGASKGIGKACAEILSLDKTCNIHCTIINLILIIPLMKEIFVGTKSILIIQNYFLEKIENLGIDLNK